ncbi:MAG: PLP-dependent lyase/thiolase [Candidatus Dormibacteria bacterium]
MSGSEPGPVAPRGQWVHAPLFGVSLAPESQLSLGEGRTPLEPAPELGVALGVPNLQLKREDRSPTGSHKARSLGLLCSALAAGGGHQAVISSSGNAAIAAAAYASLGGVRLLSLVSPRTPRVKLDRLRAFPQLTVTSERPVALLHHAVRYWGMADLRGSVNPLAPDAYRGIAAELAEAGQLGAVFLFASSGASALGIAQGFERLLPNRERPKLHVVEGSPGGELTRPWYQGSRPAITTESHLGELGSRRSRLAPAVRRAVRATGGRGWRVNSEELDEVRVVTDAYGLATSWEGIATLAAMRHAAASGGGAVEGTWVAVLTGDLGQLDQSESRTDDRPLPSAQSEEELNRLLQADGFIPTGSK